MKHLKTIMSVLMVLAAVSCTKHQTTGNGLVCFSLKNNLQITDVTRSSVSDHTTLPSAGNFIITVNDATSALVWTGKISDWDASTPLPAGNYSVTASYGSIENEGFDKPYFYGSQNFVVQGGKTSTVSVPVSLGNTIVKIGCTDNFKNYYKDYSFKITRNGNEIVNFGKDESKAAFIDGYKIVLQGVLSSETKTQSFEKEYNNLSEATAYTFLFDINNVGGATITVSFNNTVETINLGDHELND
jgi:hypothetical protein